MGGGPESRWVGRVYGLDGAVHGTIQTVLSAENRMLQLNIQCS